MSPLSRVLIRAIALAFVSAVAAQAAYPERPGHAHRAVVRAAVPTNGADHRQPARKEDSARPGSNGRESHSGAACVGRPLPRQCGSDGLCRDGYTKSGSITVPRNRHDALVQDLTELSGRCRKRADRAQSIKPIRRA
jgi:hypothetical protein